MLFICRWSSGEFRVKFTLCLHFYYSRIEVYKEGIALDVAAKVSAKYL